MEGLGLHEGAPPVRPAGSAVDAGAQNLLVNCAGVRAGHRVLVIHEDPALGWFDAEAPAAVARVARMLGAEVALFPVGGPEDGPPPGLARAQDAADVEIFFARIGDQDRFCDSRAARTCVVSYARTAEVLASAYGTRDHAAMIARRDTANRALAGAGQIRITCALGTDLAGPGLAQIPPDVSVRRFPMCVPAPVSAAGFSGRVALSGYLTPTGSRAYRPEWLALPDVVFASVERGRIAGFDGPADLVDAVRAHHEHVAGLFGIDPWVVHSWHAGLHEGCPLDLEPAANPDLWSNTVFGHPGWLHLHTCGAYAPGEICWMVAHPTVTLDGRPAWQDGRLTG